MSLPGDGSSMQLEDHWVQCDRCNNWRRVPREVADGLVDDAAWYCELNPNAQFSSCSVPQELTNEEIDQEAAEAEEEQQNLPKLPAVWQLIQGNYYSHRKRKQQDEDDIMVCHCPPPWRGGDGCGPNCINRMLCIECTEDFCPCENQCNNQMFTKKQYAKLAVRRAGAKGFGLYSEEDVGAGQFLIEYIGEVLEEEEYIRRKQYYIQTGQRHYYFMNIGNGEVIDACRKGNHARFINHSCEPNCETQKWMVRGELAIGLYTLRKIKAGEELTFDYNFERYGDKPMRCFCGSKKCRKFIGGTQESTANIVELGDADDVTNDPEPVMVREEETDAMVQAMLDKEVGTTQRGWDNKLLNRLQQLCQQKGIDWSLPEEAEGRTASTQQAAGAASPSQQESEDGSRAAAFASTSAGLSHAQAAASPASSSAPGGEGAAAKAGLDGASSPPPTVRGPLKAAFKQLKRKRNAAQDEEAAAAAAAKKSAAQQRKQERQQQLEKRRLKQQEEFIRRQLQEERRLQKLHEKQLDQQRKQQERHQLLQQKKKQRQQLGQGDESVDDDEDVEDDGAQESSSSEQPEDEEEEDEQQLEDEDLQDSDDGQHAGRPGVTLTDADLEDDMSDDDMPPARPAPAPTNRRVRVVPSSRRRPPLAPGTKAAADGGKQQKGATTASGRRSFLTLAVSTVGKQVKRRSEVDRRLEQLVAKQSFKLKEPGPQSVIKVLRMFNLCDIAPRQADPLVQQQLALHQQQQQQQQGGSKPGSPIKRSENGEAWQQQQLQRQASGSQQLEPQQQQQQQQSDAAVGSVLPQRDGVQDMHIDQAAGGTATEQCLPQLPAHLQPLQPLRGAELEARERESEARFRARQRARMADLGMLLDVVLASSSEKLKKEWVTCGILTQLQQTLTRLPMTQEYSVVLVKVIRVLEHLPVTPDDLYTARSAHGTFADLIRRMASSASDWEVRRRSHQLLKRYAASSCVDATLLQLYYVPGPNNKPYLLGLHLPPAQVSRLLALLPKNAPPPHQAGRRGEKRLVQQQQQQQQQQFRGERGFLPGPPGAMPGHPGPPPPSMSGLELQQQQQQHSSPSTSHGAALAGDGPAGQGAAPGSPPGGSSQLPQWRAAALAAAGTEEPQPTQGARPLGRGGSSSQLAAEGWDAGPPPPGGLWGPGPPPPGFHLPPAGASGVFRQNRHSRHLQQRSPGGPFPTAPPGAGPGRGGPPGPAGGRVGPPFGAPPPDANNGWHPYNGRFGASPGGYGPGAFDGPGRDWERDRDREREWDSWDRQREWDRERERDRELEMQDGRPPRYYGMPEAAAKRQRWEQEPGSRQQQSPGEPLLEQQQQQRGMPPISDLWAEAAAGGGLPHDSSARSNSRMVRSGSGVRVLELASPDDAAAAGLDPGSGSRPWQHQPERPHSRGRHSGWEPLPPPPHQQQQQQYGAGELGYGRHGPSHQQQQQRLLQHQPASVEELCSIGLYAYHQLGDAAAGNPAAASPAAWLHPPASPRAAEAAARGSLSPIISGRFSPPLHDSWLAGRARPPAPKLPPAGDGLGMEDVFCLLQDAVVADRTPGVAMSAVLAAGEQPGPPGRQQAPAAAHDSGSKQRLPQQQQQPGVWRTPGGGADGYPNQQQQPGVPPHMQGPAAARELPPNSRLPQPIQQQQQQQFPDTWDEPGPEFEAFVGDAVKRRLGKYVQPDHPNRISKEDAQSLYRKLRREVFEKEVVAFGDRQAGAAFKPIERSKLEQNIKEFVRLSIRRMHAARSNPGSMQAGFGPGGMLLPGGGMREQISGQLM